MAETQTVEAGFNSASAYQQSFGNLPSGTCYQKVDMKSLKEAKYEVDLRPKLQEAAKIGMKALNTQTGGAGTAGYALVPIYVDPRIVDLSRKYTPIVEIIPRVTNQGMTADYNQLTAKGGAVTAAEDAALTETNDTYDRQSTSIKFLYSVGRVTGPMIAAMPSYILEGLNSSG